MNISKLPINKLFNLMLSNKTILKMGVGMAEKSIRATLGGATHMKIVNGSQYILFTDGASRWKTPQDEVFGKSGMMVRKFIEPIILKMTNSAEGQQVSLLLSDVDGLKITAFVGNTTLISGTILDVFEQFKGEFGGVDIGSEVSGLLGDGEVDFGDTDGLAGDGIEDAEFEEVKE